MSKGLAVPALSAAPAVSVWSQWTPWSLADGAPAAVGKRSSSS